MLMNPKYSAPIEGFSKLTKTEKIAVVSSLLTTQKWYKRNWRVFGTTIRDFNSGSMSLAKIPSQFYFPFGVVPNFQLNQKLYMVPMVIEESSVVAAASKSAKFWQDKGGFHAEIVGTVKVGQVHFIWNGPEDLLKQHFVELKELLKEQTGHITSNMDKRGGGILDIELVDMQVYEPGYFQLKASFETCDSMGANFINSCLEEFARILQDWFKESGHFSEDHGEVHIIMSILSNYTPECRVRTWVSCPIEQLGVQEGMSSKEFAWKFEKAVKVAAADVHRATTHNKGILMALMR